MDGKLYDRAAQKPLRRYCTISVDLNRNVASLTMNHSLKNDFRNRGEVYVVVQSQSVCYHAVLSSEGFRKLSYVVGSSAPYCPRGTGVGESPHFREIHRIVFTLICGPIKGFS